MTEPTTPAPEPSPPPTPAAEPKPPVSRARRWRIRLTRLLVIVVLVGLVCRALVYFIFPPVLHKVAGLYGLNATYDRIELYLLGGDIGLWGLKLSPSEGGEPFLTVSYCRGSISTMALLRGQLHVDRAEAEGATLTVARQADGRMPLIEKLVQAGSGNTPAAQATTQPNGGSLSLEPPLTIETLRLQDAALHFTDQSVKPNADMRLNLDMLVSDIGSRQRQTTFNIGLNSPQTLAALRIVGSGSSRNNQLNADLKVSLFGLNLLPAKGYLAPFGIMPITSNISGQASGTLQAHVVGGSNGKTPATQPAALAATLKLSDMLLSAGNLPAASVGEVLIDANSLSKGELTIERVKVNKVRAAAGRTATGHLSFAGMELVPVVAAKSAATRPSTAPLTPTTVAVQAAAESTLPDVELKHLSFTDCEFAFTDGIFAPAVQLKLNVPNVTIEKLSTSHAKANQVATLSVQADAPGIAKSIDIHGTATPGTATKELNLSVSANGLDGSAVDPYLAALGLKRDIHDGKFSCRLVTQFTPHDDGSFTTALKLSDVALVDGGRPLMTMPLVLLKNAKIDPPAAKVSIGELTLVGPTLPIVHDKENVFGAIGLRTDPHAVPPTPAAPPKPSAAVALIVGPTTQPVVSPAAGVVVSSATQPQAVAGIGLPAVTIDRLSWTGVGISLHDTAGDVPVDLGVQDVQLTGKGLVFDATAKSAKPGTIDFAAKIPGVVEDVGVRGTIAPTGESIAYDVKGAVDGMSFAKLRPLMNSFGLEPVMQTGQLQFGATGDVHQAAGAIRTNLKFADVRLSDGGTTWLALGNVSVDNASFDGHTLAVDAVDVASPLLVARRDEAGGISAFGIRLLPANALPPTTQPIAKAPAMPPSTQPTGLPFVMRLGQFNLHRAKLQWNDAAVAPAADIALAADVSAQQLALGEDHKPSPFTLTLSSANLIDQLKVDGTVQLTPQRGSIALTANGSGFTGNAINPYLPPNLGMMLRGATLGAKLDAFVEQNPQGGLRGKLAVSDAAMTDAGQPQPLGAVKSMVVDVDRFDLLGRRIAIKELSLEHARLAALQWNEGLSVLGLTLSNTPLRTPKPPPPTPEPLAGVGQSDVTALMTKALEKPPWVTIDKLVLNADSLSLVSSQLGRKVELTNASLWCPGTIDVLGDKPFRAPPFDLKAYATVDPLIGQFNLSSTLRPFAADPYAKLDLDVVGIHGDKLTSVLPQFKDLLNGDDLKNGRLTADGGATFKFTRRGALGIDFSRDIGATGEMKNFSLTEEGVETPLAGLKAVQVENLRYTPSGSLFVKTLNIDTPIATVIRDESGVHALGLTLKVGLPPEPHPAPQPTTQPTTAEVTTVEATTLAAATLPATAPATLATLPATSKPAPPIVPIAPVKAPPPSSFDGAEYRIDTLSISGIDVRLEDHLGTSHTVIPLNDLDVEVKGLTNRALYQPNLPIRFSALLGSGKVELPVRKQISGGPATDFRSVFAEASANGNLTLVPKPQGYMKASISGLELTALRGLASQYGITITGGTFDGRVDVRMTGGNSFVAKAYPTLNEVRLSETPNGPIQRTFQLPSPPDAVIALIEDPDGSITFPVTVPIDAGKLDTGTIIDSAIASVGSVLRDATLAAPVKAAKLALMAFGVDVSSQRTKAIPPVQIDFASGESQLNADQLKQVQDVVARMKKDPTLVVTLQHTLGSGDITLAQQRVNPLKQDTTQLAEQYRQRKFMLQRRLAVQNGQARVALAGGGDASGTLEALRATSVQLKETEDALDQVLELLRPGADRQAERRTKQAAILLGDLRLNAVQAALLGSGLPNIEQRVNKASSRFSLDEAGGPGHVTMALVRQAKK